MARPTQWSSVPAGMAAALLGVAIGCGGCSTPTADPPVAAQVTTTSEPTDPGEIGPAATEEQPLPPGATAGLDDVNGDGRPDPTCGTQDYGGGLVVRIPCDYADYASPPTDDTTLVPNSLAGLPSAELDLTGISGSAVQGRTESGQKLVVLFISSDTLFAVGSPNLSDPATANFDAIAKLIQANWPAAPVQVRGHTDATGSAAANQTLSERRAATVVDYLSTRGIDRSRLSSVGLGHTVPVVLETNPTGQEYNRRVELAIVTSG